MRTRTILAVVLLTFCLLPAIAVGQSSNTNEIRQVRFAEHVITNELARALSPSIRNAREKCLAACEETGALELAIGLIGVSRSDVASDALVNLVGLRLDGAGSEELSCQILIRGESLLRRLERFQIAEVVSHCQVGFVAVRKRTLTQISDVTVDQVCRSESEVSRIRDELTNAITLKAVCDYE